MCGEQFEVIDFAQLAKRLCVSESWIRLQVQLDWLSVKHERDARRVRRNHLSPLRGREACAIYRKGIPRAVAGVTSNNVLRT